MNEEKKKIVLFDFDGVLVESLDLWFDVTQKNNPTLTKEEYSAMSNGNYLEAFELKGLTYTDDGLKKYREELLAMQMPKAIRLFIQDNSEKYIFTIVSSGSEVTIENFLAKEGIVKNFSTILGHETHAKKSVKIKNLLELYSIDAYNAVFITDTLGDILEAHEAGVRSVGVLWGLHDRETLEKGNPEIVIDSPEDLEKTITSILDK